MAGTKILDAQEEVTSLDGNIGIPIQTPTGNKSQFTLLNTVIGFIFGGIFSGNAGKLVIVNSGENGLDVTDPDNLTEYQSAFTGIPVTPIGGIESGETSETLRGLTQNQINDKLIFKRNPAVYTLPTVTLIKTSGFNFYKFGSTPTINFQAVYNNTPAAGGLSSWKLKKNNVDLNTLSTGSFTQNTSDTPTLDTTVLSYKVNAIYPGGIQLVDTPFGDPSGSPIASGNVDSNTITVQGLLPVLTKIGTTLISNPVTLDNSFTENYKGNNNPNSATGAFVNGDPITLVLNANTKSVVLAIDNTTLGTLGNLEQVDANGVVEGNPTIPTVYTATFLGRNYNVYNYTFASVPSGTVRFKYTL